MKSLAERITIAEERGASRGRSVDLTPDGPPSWLSGEWAGESIPELLGDLLEGMNGDEQDVICTAYEDAADAAYDARLTDVASYVAESLVRGGSDA